MQLQSGSMTTQGGAAEGASQPATVWPKVVVLAVLAAGAGLLMLFRMPTTFSLAESSVDANWILELDNQLRQGNILGRDLYFTYGPLAQVLASSVAWISPGPSSLYNYGASLIFIDILGLVALAAALILIRDLDWLAAATTFCVFFMFHPLIFLRPLLSVLGIVLLSRALALTPRRRRAWGIIIGVIWFLGQLMTFDVVFLAATSAVGMTLLTAALSVGRFQRLPFQKTLLPTRIYLETIAISVAVLLLGNLCLELFYRISSASYVGGDYVRNGLSGIQGYIYTMGSRWSIDTSMTISIVLLSIYTIVMAIWIGYRRGAYHWHLFLGLTLISILQLRSVTVRSDFGHLLLAITPMSLLFVIIICLSRRWRVAHYIGLLILILNLLFWQPSNAGTLRILTAILTGEMNVPARISQIQHTVVDVDSIVPQNLRANVGDTKLFLTFPEANSISIALGKSSFIPVIQAYAAHNTQLQTYYIEKLEHQKKNLEILYGMDIGASLDGVQYVSRTPFIFQYIYENYQLKTAEIFRGSFFLLIPREHPLPMSYTPIQYSTQISADQSASVTLQQPATCGLLQMELSLSYPVMTAIGRPAPLIFRAYDGQGLVRETRLLPIEVGKPFTTYVYLGPDQSFSHLFRINRDDQPQARFDHLTLESVPGDLLDVKPSMMQFSQIRCVGEGTHTPEPTVISPSESIDFIYALPGSFQPTDLLKVIDANLFMHADDSLELGPFQTTGASCLTSTLLVDRPKDFDYQADGVDFVVVIHDGTTIIHRQTVTVAAGGYAAIHIPLPTKRTFQVRLETYRRANPFHDWAFWVQPRIAPCD